VIEVGVGVVGSSMRFGEEAVVVVGVEAGSGGVVNIGGGYATTMAGVRTRASAVLSSPLRSCTRLLPAILPRHLLCLGELVVSSSAVPYIVLCRLSAGRTWLSLLSSPSPIPSVPPLRFFSVPSNHVVLVGPIKHYLLSSSSSARFRRRSGVI